MIQDNLSREIAKKIISNLGFSPNAPKEVGLNSKSLILDKKIQVEENSLVKDYNVYSGCVNFSDGKEKIITLTNLGSVENPELFIVFFNEFGLIFNWNDPEDCGSFLIKIEKTWMKMPLTSKLHLLVFIECVTDTGLLWLSHSNVSEEFTNLVSLINHEERVI